MSISAPPYEATVSRGLPVALRIRRNSISPSRPDYREKVWDQAAGAIVIEEAGGKVTDLDGKPLDFTQGRTLANNRGICASNGVLHKAALDALREIGA
jgi:3'(2'), 5'-bisphosphate nucleotidase